MKEIEALTGLKNLIQIFKLCSEINVDLKDIHIMNPKAYKEAIETVLNLLENQKAEIEEKDKSLKLHTKLEYQYKNDYLNVIEDLKNKDKMINEYEKECRQFKAFCKRVRRDEKHDVDLFNQGLEHKCNQFLNLISVEPHWSYEGKYFDDTDNQIKQYFENKAEEEKGVNKI